MIIVPNGITSSKAKFDHFIIYSLLSFKDAPYKIVAEKCVPPKNEDMRAVYGDHEDPLTWKNLFFPLAFDFKEDSLGEPFDYRHFCKDEPTADAQLSRGNTLCTSIVSYDVNPSTSSRSRSVSENKPVKAPKVFYFKGNIPIKKNKFKNLNHFLVPTISGNKTVIFCAFYNSKNGKEKLKTFIDNYLSFKEEHAVAVDGDLVFSDGLDIFISFDTKMVKC